MLIFLKENNGNSILKQELVFNNWKEYNETNF
jgi:hypothetical protein